MFKLRTFDVWDTLLRRTGHPDLSKKISAHALILNYYNEIKECYKSVDLIYIARCEIERDFASLVDGNFGEYKIYEVINSLLEKILIDTSNVDFISKQIVQLEINFEIDNTYPDPFIVDFAKKYPAEKTLFLSDFYMSAKTIAKLLKKNGLDDLVSEGISSCDIGLNKRSGEAYKYLHNIYKLNPEEHVHIGDNLEVDVKIPEKLGINSVHFEPSKEHNKRVKACSYLNNRVQLIQDLAKENFIKNKDITDELQAEAKSGYLLGINSSLLLIGYILYIAERSLIDKVEKIFFLTREGEFYLEIWGNLFPDNKLFGLDLPPVDILEVSRLATFCASLREVSINEMMRVWNLYSNQSIYAFLKTLGLDEKPFLPICKKYDIDIYEDILYPWQEKRVINLFKDIEFVDSINSKIESDRNYLDAYLKAKGWTSECKRVAVVDIGWRGTIQDNLSYLRNETQTYGYYMGLQKFLNDQPGNSKKYAYGPNLNKGNKNFELLNAVTPLEMLCNSPNGSVTGYAYKDNKPFAIRNVDNDENEVYYRFVQYFQKGVLSSCNFFSKYINSQLIDSNELREFSLLVWKGIISKPEKDLSLVYSSLTHNEVFGVGGFVNKGDVPSIKNVVKSIFLKKERNKLIFYIKQTQWSAVIWNRKDLGNFHKIIIVSLLKIGLIYKKIRNYIRFNI